MAIEWNPSRGATLGVEWEVQLIDAETKMLRQEAGKLLADLPVVGRHGRAPADSPRADAIDPRGGHRHLQHGVGSQGGPGQNDHRSPAGRV